MRSKYMAPVISDCLNILSEDFYNDNVTDVQWLNNRNQLSHSCPNNIDFQHEFHIVENRKNQRDIMVRGWYNKRINIVDSLIKLYFEDMKKFSPTPIYPYWPMYKIVLLILDLLVNIDKLKDINDIKTFFSDLELQDIANILFSVKNKLTTFKDNKTNVINVIKKFTLLTSTKEISNG